MPDNTRSIFIHCMRARTLKLAIDNSNLGGFSRDRLSFEPCKSRLIVPDNPLINLGITSMSTFLGCDYCQRLYGKSPHQNWLLMGESSNFLSYNPRLQERKLCHLGPALFTVMEEQCCVCSIHHKWSCYLYSKQQQSRYSIVITRGNFQMSLSSTNYYQKS